MNFEEKMLEMLSEIKGDITELKSDVATVKGDITELKTDMAAVKGDITELKTDMVTVKSDTTELKTDMAAAKDDIAELQDSARRIGVIQENIVVPRLDSLAAGQKSLRKISAPAKSVEQITEDISVLKSVVKAHSNRLAALERAQ